MEFYDQLYLHDLVRLCGFDLDRTRALRNQVSSTRTSSWELWQSDRAAFELHQGLFKKPRLDSVSSVVGFVQTADDEALFVGVWDVIGCHLCPRDKVDPVTGEYKQHLYEFRSTEWLNCYVERMVVDWARARSWVRRLPSTKKPIAVTEIRPSGWYKPFPGYAVFQTSLREVAGYTTAWKIQLSANRGIYLLVHPETGEQYVGSATGQDGFLGRWRDYTVNGHGGNELLRPLAEGGIPNYQISVLEVAGSGMSDEDVLAREATWKDKLGSRAHGLNLN